MRRKLTPEILDDLVGKTVIRYLCMHPRRFAMGVYKVLRVQYDWGVSKDTVVYLEGYMGPVHVDAVAVCEIV